ncbi:unnamed protein product, partial [Symbiodinium sp. KB8]
ITSVVILVNPPGGSLAVPSPKNTPTSMALASCVKGGEWKEGGPGIVQQVQVPQPKIQAIDTHLKVAKIDGRLPISYPTTNKGLIYVYGYNCQEAGDGLE